MLPLGLDLNTLIPASPDTDTSPVSGRDGGPARLCARSQGRGCARPASEGSLDESTSRLEGMRPNGMRLMGCLSLYDGSAGVFCGDGQGSGFTLPTGLFAGFSGGNRRLQTLAEGLQDLQTGVALAVGWD